MADMPAKPMIRIMADFGNGPWAWGSDGCCIASVGWGPEEYEISEELKKDFADWVTEFERNSDRFCTLEEHLTLCKALGLSEKETARSIEEFKAMPPFDWQSFNTRGLTLAKRLYDELGGNVEVVYQKPGEDPDHAAEEPTVIH